MISPEKRQGPPLILLRKLQGRIKLEAVFHKEKEVPQPQEAVAWGFSILNDWPMRSSTKSTTEPSMYWMETSSTTTVAPSRSITSSSPSGVRATAKGDWTHERAAPRRVAPPAPAPVEGVLDPGAAASVDADSQHRARRLAGHDLVDAAGGALRPGDSRHGRLPPAKGPPPRGTRPA